MSNLSSFLSIKNSLILGGVFVIAFFIFYTPLESESFEQNKTYEFAEYEFEHPFPADSTNLLPSAITKNADIKSRLNKYDVRAALDYVFIEQDFKMVKDTFLTFGSLIFPISGYDPERKIGYVWIDYDRFGEGIMDKKLGRSKTQKEGEQNFLKSIDDGLEKYFDDEETFLDDVFGNDEIAEAEIDRNEIMTEWRLIMDSMSRGEVQFQDVQHKYRKYQRTFTDESTILDEWDFFGNTLDRKSEFVRTYGEEVRSQLQANTSHAGQKEYLEIILKEFRKALEINYLSAKQNKSMLDEWKLSAAKMIKDPQRFFGFTSLIDQIRMYSPNRKLLSSLDDQVFQIDMYTSSKDWWKHSMAIIELFNVNKTPSLYNKDRYQTLLGDIMASNKYSKWKKRYHEIEALANFEALSLTELKSLSGLAFEKGICIAPISILDNRMIYDMEEETHLEKLTSLRAQIKSSKNKKARKKLHEKLMDLSLDRSVNYGEIRKKAKAKSILKLQSDLREFINWAEVQTQQISYKD